MPACLRDWASVAAWLCCASSGGDDGRGVRKVGAGDVHRFDRCWRRAAACAAVVWARLGKGVWGVGGGQGEEEEEDRRGPCVRAEGLGGGG